MFPFMDGSEAVNIENKTFTLRDKLTVDMIINPRFAFDDSTLNNEPILNWRIDGTHLLLFYYNNTTDTINAHWTDGTTARTMESVVFDNGSSFVNLNQRIRITGSFDLSSGGINDSRWIVIPLETGSFLESSAWDGVPDVLTH